MNKSTFLLKPQTAPITTPTVMLMRAQTSARETEMLEPYHTASKVD